MPDEISKTTEKPSLRILQLCRPATGGIVSHLRNLSEELTAQNIVSGLAAPASALATFEDAHRNAISVFICPIPDRPHLITDLAAARQLARIATAWKPDIIHAHGYRAAWVASLAGLRIPWVFTAHNLLGKSFQSRILAGRLTKAASAIAVSNAVAESVSAVNRRLDNIDIIPNGVKVLPKNAGPDQAGARSVLRIPYDDKVVLCVARLVPDKGVDILLAAWQFLVTEIPDARLVIVGDGPDRPKLERAAAGTGSVSFAGFVPQLSLYYSSADVLVIPSRREGQSIVCLEAMAADPGPLVVATDAGGLPEMVRDGVTGILVCSDDPVSLSAGIARCLKIGPEAQAIKAAAAEMVRSRFNERAMASSVASVYRKVLTRS